MLNMPKANSILVLISADAEWNVVIELFKPQKLHTTPFGNYFHTRIAGQSVILYNSGWGKTSTAGACQYGIDQWKPNLLINLGTCGGVLGRTTIGETLIVNETAMYDLKETMSDYAQAIDYYESRANLSWLPESLPMNTRIARIVSADQDFQIENYDLITDIFHADAVDWESSAFAWIASRNHVPWLVLRVVSDLVSPTHSETQANIDLWKERTNLVMAALIQQLPWYICQFTSD